VYISNIGSTFLNRLFSGFIIFIYILISGLLTGYAEISSNISSLGLVIYIIFYLRSGRIG
jgi:hypothetical protein